MTTRLERLKELAEEMAEDNAFPYREVGAAWPDILRVLEAARNLPFPSAKFHSWDNNIEVTVDKDRWMGLNEALAMFEQEA